MGRLSHVNFSESLHPPQAIAMQPDYIEHEKIRNLQSPTTLPDRPRTFSPSSAMEPNSLHCEKARS